MGGIFSYDSALIQFLNKLATCIYLNLLWILFSIPIVTIGASTSALYYVSLKLAKDEDGSTFSSFFFAFRNNFKKATIIWIIYLIFGIILFVDSKILQLLQISALAHLLLQAAFIFVSLILLITGIYIFPLLAKFENNIPTYFKNAFILGIRFLISTILLLITHGVGAFFVYAFPPFLFFFAGLIALLNSYILNRIFDRLIPKDEENTEVDEVEKKI